MFLRISQTHFVWQATCVWLVIPNEFCVISWVWLLLLYIKAIIHSANSFAPLWCKAVHPERIKLCVCCFLTKRISHAAMRTLLKYRWRVRNEFYETMPQSNYVAPLEWLLTIIHRFTKLNWNWFVAIFPLLNLTY